MKIELAKKNIVPNIVAKNISDIYGYLKGLTIVLYMGTLYHSWPLSSYVFFFKIPNRWSSRTQRMGVKAATSKSRHQNKNIKKNNSLLRKNNSKNSNNIIIHI